MNAVETFAALRAHKRSLTGNPLDALTQDEVDAFNAVIGKWKQVQPKLPTKLADPQAFFKSLRAAFGDLEQAQVDGFNAVLTAMGAARWPIAWAAYGLATAWWETNKTMQPVEEAYYLAGKVKDLDAWRRKNFRYYPWHGRGYVQLTWQRNYELADVELKLGGKLLADRALAMRPDIAAQIMVRGMEQAWFTSKGLRHYLPISGHAGHDAYMAARRIINGQDKATEIAKIALVFEAALEAGGWA